MIAGGASAHYTFAHLNAAVREKGFDVKVDDVTDQIAVMSIQGRNR